MGFAGSDIPDSLILAQNAIFSLQVIRLTWLLPLGSFPRVMGKNSDCTDRRRSSSFVFADRSPHRLICGPTALTSCDQPDRTAGHEAG